MLGSTVLDVGIGLILIYFLLSLICSTINEGISNLLGLRAASLKEGLNNLLGSDVAKGVFDHQLVKGLVQKDALPWKRRPSYIPTRTFVMAALNSLNGQNFPATVDEVRVAVQNVKDEDVRRALLALIDDARGDFDKMKDNLGVWFDHSMDRVSGWYRRKIQSYILIIAIFISFGLGVDTLALVKFLRADSALRESLVAIAKDEVEKPSASTGSDGVTPIPGAQPNAAQNLKQDVADLEALQTQFFNLNIPRYPLYYFKDRVKDWQAGHPQGQAAAGVTQTPPTPGFLVVLWFWFWQHSLGFVITAVALSLGSPFWFDLLNKLVSLRSTGQKPKPEAATIQTVKG
jgi:hypothetical protein